MQRIFRIVLFVLATVVAQPALADPGGWDGTNGYGGPVAVRYPIVGADGVFTEHLGDGTNAQGGTAPYYTNGMPANIPSPTTADEMVNSGQTTGDNDEFKFRFSLHGNHALAEDTLHNHCQRSGAHPHEFLGAVRAGGCSTYAQLRNDGIALKAAGKLPSTNPGPTINLASYWHSGMIDCGLMSAPLGTGTNAGALGDGVCRLKRSLVTPLYYQPSLAGVATVAKAAVFTPIPLGFGVVFGRNMDDPWMLRERANIAAANAANIAHGGSAVYQDFDPMGMVAGFNGWECTAPDGTVRAKGIQLSIDDLDCNAGDLLIVTLNSQSCWDGHNGNSPFGREQVVSEITVITNGVTNQHVCPYDYWKTLSLVDKPQWVLKSAISSTVANDSPFLASDAMFQAKARADAGKCVTATAWGSSATVCAPADAATFVCKPGCSAHADYLAAWDGSVFWTAFNKCTATPIPQGLSFSWLPTDRTPAGTGCNANTFDMTPGSQRSLIFSPLFTAPTNAAVDGSAINEYYPMPIPKGHMGGMTLSHQ